MAKHTPLPWNWLNYPDGRKLLVGPNNAVIHCPDAPIQINKEDQDLIGAAPDLLTACLAAREQLTLIPIWSRDIQATIDTLDAAIRQAEGGSRS